MWFSWLAYSAVENGTFCKFCVAFSKSEGGVNFQPLGSLVLKKFDNWKHAVETFNKHCSLEYHKKYLFDASYFFNMFKTVKYIYFSHHNTNRMFKTSFIKPINVEVIMLCGR